MPPARRVALVASRLFDSATGELRSRPVVLIDGEQIVGVTFGADPPADYPVDDLGDATLVPGLVDTHVHLAFDASIDPVATLAGRSDEQVTAAMAEAARTALHAGVTTVRDLGDRDYLALALRGRADLPTILAAGPPITLPRGHCHYLGGCVEASPEGLRRGVRERFDRGVDAVKIMASGGTLTPGTLQHVPQFGVDELAAAVDEAHRLGLPVTAHAHATAAIVNALDAGVDGLEHATFWTEDSVESPPEVLARVASSGVFVGATLGVLPPRPGLPGPPAAVAARVPLMLANTQILNAAGARLVVGTDAGVGPPKPHDVLPHALTMLHDAGIPLDDGLRLMTAAGAEACGLGNRKGRLADGYDADVLAVAGDPTADPAALLDVRAVYRRGARVR